MLTSLKRCRMVAVFAMAAIIFALTYYKKDDFIPAEETESILATSKRRRLSSESAISDGITDEMKETNSSFYKKTDATLNQPDAAKIIHKTAPDERTTYPHADSEREELRETQDEGIRQCTTEERVAHLRERCKYHKFKPHFMVPVNRTLVDSFHKLAYCFISKAGCTALKTLLGTATSKRLQEDMPKRIHSVDELARIGLYELSTFGNKEKEHILQKYFTFFVVRHPFDRLVSVWRDKILHAAPGTGGFKVEARLLNWPKYILQKYRPWLFKENPKLSEMRAPQLVVGDVRFDEFAQWVADAQKSNDHWRKIVDSCNPCAHDWSAIFRTESMEADRKVLLRKLKDDLVDADTGLVHSYHTSLPYTPRKQLVHWQNVSSSAVDYFLKEFKVDMDLFGYGWDKETQTATCEIQTNSGVCC